MDRWRSYANDPGMISAWLAEPALLNEGAVVIDLSFDDSPERIHALERSSFCLVSSVSRTLTELPAHFARFNGWPGFSEGPVIEAACRNETDQQIVTDIFSVFGKRPEWVADVPGFISARIVSMIINEAFLTAQENVSTEQAIDTAMKLGTNYPYGPFEWCEKIGAASIVALLEKLSVQERRYTPAVMLKKMARS